MTIITIVAVFFMKFFNSKLYIQNCYRMDVSNCNDATVNVCILCNIYQYI